MWVHGLVSFFYVCVCVALGVCLLCHVHNVVIVSGLFIIGYPLSGFSDVNH